MNMDARESSVSETAAGYLSGGLLLLGGVVMLAGGVAAVEGAQKWAESRVAGHRADQAYVLTDDVIAGMALGTYNPAQEELTQKELQRLASEEASEQFRWAGARASVGASCVYYGLGVMNGCVALYKSRRNR